MHRTPVRALAALALVLPLAGCGGSSDPKALTDDGMAALQSGDFDVASQKLGAALEGMEPSNPSYERAFMGKVRADLRDDPARAKDDFLAYAEANSSSVTPDDFSSIGREFASAGAFSEAIDILDAGMQMHAESPVLLKLADNIKTAAEEAGDSGALDKMAGLGYL